VAAVSLHAGSHHRSAGTLAGCVRVLVKTPPGISGLPPVASGSAAPLPPVADQLILSAGDQGSRGCVTTNTNEGKN